MTISVSMSSNTVFLYSFWPPPKVWVRAMKKWPSFRISIWQRESGESWNSGAFVGGASVAVPAAAALALLAALAGAAPLYVLAGAGLEDPNGVEAAGAGAFDGADLAALGAAWAASVAGRGEG